MRRPVCHSDDNGDAQTSEGRISDSNSGFRITLGFLGLFSL
jgi:hypothetical protein